MWRRHCHKPHQLRGVGVGGGDKAPTIQPHTTHVQAAHTHTAMHCSVVPRCASAISSPQPHQHQGAHHQHHHHHQQSLQRRQCRWSQHTHTAQAQAPPADGHRLVIACVPHVCIDTVQSFCAWCSLTTSMAQQQQRPPAPSVVCVHLAHLTIHHTCHIRHPSCSGQHTRVVWVSRASDTVHTHAQTQTPHQTTNVQPCCLWV